MKVLCVAEKHSVAKAVAQILGGSYNTRATNDKVLFNLDFKYYFPGWGNCDVTMTSVRGHLLSLDFPKEAGWNKIQPVELFNFPIETKITKGLEKVAANIRNEARSAEKLIIWTDCDREGEYIGWEISEQARKSNSRIEIKRAIFSDLERSHILHAAQMLVQLDMRAVDAVEIRQELDLRTGAAFTRLQTTYLQSKFRQHEFELVSYGNCQFPTLGFVVDRFLKVKYFIPEKFWYITLKVRNGRKHLEFHSKRGHIFDRASATVIYKRLIDSKKSPEVNEILKRPTSKLRPLPLTTVELLKLSSKHLKISSKNALKYAEDLYQQGFISYPRTETDQFSSEVDLRSLIDKQKQHPEWGEYSTALLEDIQTPRRGKNNDKAHPPIHPITHATKFKTNDHKRIFELITRHFLACCSKDAKGLLTIIELDWYEEKFSISGTLITERNFLDVYPYIKWNSSNELPEFKKDQKLSIVESLLAEGKTSPPSYLTESELLSLMDLNGIGTDATMADHIQKILDRGYIFRSNSKGDVKETPKSNKGLNYLIPSNMGIALVEGYDKIGLEKSLTKPHLRRDFEKKLAEISKGEARKQTVLEATLETFRNMFLLTSTNIFKIGDAVKRNFQ